MTIETPIDRRRFFRINDAIGVAYQVMDDNFSEGDEDRQECDDLSVAALLDQHNHAIAEAIHPIQKDQPLVARALMEMSKKIDTLLSLYELEALTIHNRYQHFDQASISACGIAFPVSENLSLKTELLLNLYLLPSEYEMTIKGRVVACETIGPKYYYLRVEFFGVSEENRERLIQHVIQRQSTLLKTLREDIS